LGEEHPSVAASLNNLALLYDSQGRYAEAEPLYQQALEMTKRLLGEEHPSVATSLNNLAGLYNSQGRYAEAEPLYQQALDIAKQVLGANHLTTVTIRENLQMMRILKAGTRKLNPSIYKL
jgi:tetratricopeptide (TPR) repeat protein